MCSWLNCRVSRDPTVFSDIPRVNLSFDKLAYTGSDSCFGWLETQGTGIHFTVGLVAKVSLYAFHFFFFPKFKGHMEGALGVIVVQCLKTTRRVQH